MFGLLCGFNAPPHSLENSNVNSKVKIMEKRVGVCSLAHNTSRVKGCARALRWGLGWMTSKSIIHTNLWKPNKLVSAWLKHFWCTNEPRAYTNSQDSPQLRLGGNLAITFPFIVLLSLTMGATSKCHFVPKLPTWGFRNSVNWDYWQFGGP
jgi:hypothetical protein